MSTCFLSPEDLNLIDQYRLNFALNEDESASTDPTPIKEVLRPYFAAKENLHSLMNITTGVISEANNTIISKPISYSLPSAKIIDKFMKDPVITKFRQNFYTTITTAANVELIAHRYDLMNLVTYEALVNNTYTDIDFTIKDIKINKGCKPMKVLAKLSKIYNIPNFEEFRLTHSRLLNDRTQKGTLCLSIHPLDYFTMSDNANNWHSCMSWQRDGEYHMGTIQMMTSPNVVVAYLKSDKETLEFTDNSTGEVLYWNSKKWRTLLVVDPKEEIVCAIKDYPYQSDELETLSLEFMKEILEVNNINFAHSISQFTPKEANSGEFMYNDFGCRAVNDKYYHLGYVNTDSPRIHYGGEPICIWCGNTVSSYHEADRLLCSNCSAGISEPLTCDYCEDDIYNEDEVYYVDNVRLCSHCYDAHAVYTIDGMEHVEDNCIPFCVIPDDVEPTVDTLNEAVYTGFVYQLNNPLKDLWASIEVDAGSWFSYKKYYIRASEVPKEIKKSIYAFGNFYPSTYADFLKNWEKDFFGKETEI